MDHTTNYNLNQWEAMDRVTRADFNADNSKIDAALKTVADAAAGGAQIACGAYTGDGTADRVISLGFTPRMVFVCNDSGQCFEYDTLWLYYGGLAFPDAPMKFQTYEYLSVAEGGFRVTYQALQNNSRFLMTNASNATYRYFAVK